MKKIRLFLVGVGGYGANYVRLLSALQDPDVCVEGICEVAPGAAERHPMVAEQHIPVYRTIEEFYREHGADLAVISTPIHLHHGQVLQCLEHDSHVLVEKPMAGDMEQAREMLALEQPGGPVTMIAENFYYRKSVLTAADWIQAGKIGAPTAALVQVLSHFPRDAKWLVESDWRRDCVGGIMLDRDVHWFAAIRTLFGEVRSAVGYQRTIRGDVGPAEQVSLHMIFENRAMGTFTDIASIVGVQQMPFILVGSEGTITIENFQRVTLQTLAGETQTIAFPEGDGGGYVEEFEDFYRAIRTGSTPRASFAQCYKDLQLGMTSLMTNDRWQQLELVD